MNEVDNNEASWNDIKQELNIDIQNAQDGSSKWNVEGLENIRSDMYYYTHNKQS